MASNLRVDTILPSTGTNVAIGTASGSVTFLGDTDITTSGSVSIGGTLTYEDVTNVDSVGVITARSGIDAASNLLLKTGGTERVRIDSNGHVGLSINNMASYHSKDLVINSHDNGGITLVSATNEASGITFADGTGTPDKYTGYIQYDHNGNSMAFGVNGGSEKLRIGSAGQLGIGGANYGTSGQFLQSQGASSAVQWASVSTDLQFAQWRVTTPFGGGNVDPITNWSETDANATLTQSGGIFSFPSTGYWEIMMQMYGYKNTDNDNIELHIMTTTNNSSYTTRSWAYSHMNNDDGGNLYVSIRASLIFDVTDTSTHKIKFKTINNTVNWAADSGRNDSYAIFKRLAAT